MQRSVSNQVWSSDEGTKTNKFACLLAYFCIKQFNLVIDLKLEKITSKYFSSHIHPSINVRKAALSLNFSKGSDFGFSPLVRNDLGITF